MTMTTTDPYDVALQTMRDELAAVDTRARNLRSALKTLETLIGAAPARRTRQSRNTADVPAEFADLSAKDRVLKVMREWGLEALAVATHTPNPNTLRSALHDLVKNLVVERGGQGTWRLAAPSADEAG
jgi:hypothetical protein